MPVAVALQFAQQHLRVDLDPEVVELAHQNITASPIGDGSLLVQQLLEIEDVAVARRWETLDMDKWRAAGLTWPLIRPLRVRSVAPKTSGRMYLVSERHAKLLRHFDQADDAGKLFIEQSAVLAAAPRQQPAPHQ
jgi:hypothetical protein